MAEVSSVSTVRCVVEECGCRCRYQVSSSRQAAKKRSLSMEVKKTGKVLVSVVQMGVAEA